MILYSSVECIVYDAQSLKNKRAIIQRVLTRLKQKFNVSVAEMEFQDVWQRTKIGIAIVSSSKVQADREMQKALEFIDSFPELERTITHIEWL